MICIKENGFMKSGYIRIGERYIPVTIGNETPKIYKKAFNCNLWMDLKIEGNRSDENYNVQESDKRAFQLVWSMAKTANPGIQRMDRWVKQFTGVSGVFLLSQVVNLMTGKR